MSVLNSVGLSPKMEFASAIRSTRDAVPEGARAEDTRLYQSPVHFAGRWWHNSYAICRHTSSPKAVSIATL